MPVKPTTKAPAKKVAKAKFMRKARSAPPPPPAVPAKTKRTNRKLPKPTAQELKNKAFAQKIRKSRAAAPVKPASLPLTPALSSLERAFAIEYSFDQIATQAYLRVKPAVSTRTASTEGSAMLGRPDVKAFVKLLIDRRQPIAEISASAALQEAWAMSQADSRELMELRIGCCRHCWGFRFGYQRTDNAFEDEQASFEQAKAMADEKGKAKLGEFRTKGGPGFDMRAAANPDCPECAGEGVAREVFNDTRKISKGAASLLAGVERTKSGGIRMLTHSKDAALDKVFRHFGIYNDKLLLSMPVAVIKDLTGRKPRTNE